MRENKIEYRFLIIQQLGMALLPGIKQSQSSRFIAQDFCCGILEDIIGIGFFFSNTLLKKPQRKKLSCACGSSVSIT
jgi:hypothetical protein